METNYREGDTIMKKGKNKHNRKIWELVEKYFYGNIKEAINFFDKECKEMGANSKTYEAEYYSEDKKTNRKLIICDSRPPFDDEDNYIHVGIGNENEKQYEREYEKLYEKYLYHKLPPVDLLIRTSGEMRISNFMLWQCSYAEFYFPKVYFPDFDDKAFEEALIEYNKRNRRFGGVNNDQKSN